MEQKQKKYEEDNEDRGCWRRWSTKMKMRRGNEEGKCEEGDDYEKEDGTRSGW